MDTNGYLGMSNKENTRIRETPAPPRPVVLALWSRNNLLKLGTLPRQLLLDVTSIENGPALVAARTLLVVIKLLHSLNETRSAKRRVCKPKIAASCCLETPSTSNSFARWAIHPESPGRKRRRKLPALDVTCPTKVHCLKHPFIQRWRCC